MQPLLAFLAFAVVYAVDPRQTLAAEGTLSDEPPPGFVVEHPGDWGRDRNLYCEYQGPEAGDPAGDPEAIALFEQNRKGAETGQAEAQYGLGLQYEAGSGVCRDREKAREWFQRAAAQGHAGAKYKLGNIYNLLGDDAEAFRWYRSAADSGHREAQFATGHALEYGVGVPRNYAKAAEWYEKAAIAGHPRAMYRLGLLFRDGRGVPEDLIKAYAWMSVSAALGERDARMDLGMLEGEFRGKPWSLNEAQELSDHLFERYGRKATWRNAPIIDSDPR